MGLFPLMNKNNTTNKKNNNKTKKIYLEIEQTTINTIKKTLPYILAVPLELIEPIKCNTIIKKFNPCKRQCIKQSCYCIWEQYITKQQKSTQYGKYFTIQPSFSRLKYLKKSIVDISKQYSININISNLIIQKMLPYIEEFYPILSDETIQEYKLVLLSTNLVIFPTNTIAIVRITNVCTILFILPNIAIINIENTSDNINNNKEFEMVSISTLIQPAKRLFKNESKEIKTYHTDNNLDTIKYIHKLIIDTSMNWIQSFAASSVLSIDQHVLPTTYESLEDNWLLCLLNEIRTTFSTHFNLTKLQLDDLCKIYDNTKHILQNHQIVFMPIAYISYTINMKEETNGKYNCKVNHTITNNDDINSFTNLSYEDRLDILLEAFTIGTSVYQQQVFNSHIEAYSEPLLNWFIQRQVMLKMGIYNDGSSLLSRLTNEPQLIELIKKLKYQNKSLEQYLKSIQSIIPPKDGVNTMQSRSILQSVAYKSQNTDSKLSSDIDDTYDSKSLSDIDESTTKVDEINGDKSLSDIDESKIKIDKIYLDKPLSDIDELATKIDKKNDDKSKVAPEVIGGGSTTVAATVLLSSPSATISPISNASSVYIAGGNTALSAVTQQIGYLSPILLAVNIGVQSYTIANEKNNKIRVAVLGAGTLTGSVGGGIGGSVAGAVIGTAIFPGVGTIVGGILGSVAGGYSGAWGGKKITTKLMDTIQNTTADNDNKIPSEPMVNLLSALSKNESSSTISQEYNTIDGVNGSSPIEDIPSDPIVEEFLRSKKIKIIENQSRQLLFNL